MDMPPQFGRGSGTNGARPARDPRFARDPIPDLDGAKFDSISAASSGAT